ncbi:MAG: hypothetical protein AAB250_00125, partial [Bdellovibrionota bacterium]
VLMALATKQKNTKTSKSTSGPARMEHFRVKNYRALKAVEVPEIADLANDPVARRELLEAVQEIQNLENSVEKMRQFNGQYQRSSLIKAKLRLDSFDDHLVAGENGPAVDIYRTLFREVELKFWIVKSVDKRLSELDKSVGSRETGDVKAERLSLAKERSDALKLIGENYGEYVSARELLEKIIATEGNIGPSVFGPAPAPPGHESHAERALYAAAAKKVMASLGIKNLAQLFPKLGLPNERAALADLKTLFRTEPEALKAKLKKDRADGRWATLKVFTLAGPILNAIDGMVSRFPAKFADSIRAITGLAHRVSIRNKYIPMIERVLNLPENPLMRLELVRKLNSQNPNDEFLVVFARTVDATQTWSDMKAEAVKQGATNTIYATYAERMVDAEARAKKAGDLALNYDSSPADKVALVTAAAIPAVGYAGHTYLPEISSALHGFAVVAGQLLGF